MAESVYKVIELIGTSKDSWEKAAAAAVSRAGKSLRDLRVQSGNASDLEAVYAGIERKVESRTRALSEAKDRFRTLVENIEAVPFE